MFLGLPHARVHPPSESFRHPRFAIAAFPIPFGQHWLFHHLAFGVVHTVSIRRCRSARIQGFCGHCAIRGRDLSYVASNVVATRRTSRNVKRTWVQTQHVPECVEVPYVAGVPSSAAVPVLVRFLVRRSIVLTLRKRASRPPSHANRPRMAHTHRVHHVDRRRRARPSPTGRMGRGKGKFPVLLEIERERLPIKLPFQRKRVRWESLSGFDWERRALSTEESSFRNRPKVGSKSSRTSSRVRTSETQVLVWRQFFGMELRRLASHAMPRATRQETHGQARAPVGFLRGARSRRVGCARSICRQGREGCEGCDLCVKGPFLSRRKCKDNGTVFAVQGKSDEAFGGRTPLMLR